MARKRVSPELVAAQAEQFHDLPLSATRAKELAADVDVLVGAVFEAAERIDFNDDPARFAATLAALRQPR